MGVRRLVDQKRWHRQRIDFVTRRHPIVNCVADWWLFCFAPVQRQHIRIPYFGSGSNSYVSQGASCTNLVCIVFVVLHAKIERKKYELCVYEVLSRTVRSTL